MFVPAVAVKVGFVAVMPAKADMFGFDIACPHGGAGCDADAAAAFFNAAARAAKQVVGAAGFVAFGVAEFADGGIGTQRLGGSLRNGSQQGGEYQAERCRFFQ